MRARSLLAAALLAASSASLAIPEGPAYPSAQWIQREAANFAKVSEAPAEQLAQPAFMDRLVRQSLGNINSYTARSLADPSWTLGYHPLLQALLAQPTSAAAIQAALLAQAGSNPALTLALSLNTPLTPLCATWAVQCAGDPFRYAAAAGVDGRRFYTDEAIVTPVVYYDRECARISGRVWAPRTASGRLPSVVIENGSVQAPETLYWWMAQTLVRNGYTVMTFDPRGQGRSDQQTPAGEPGSNFNPSVFWEGLVDAIDFFRSTPTRPYPHNATCAGTYPTPVTRHNPLHALNDRNRLGIVGHSLGAAGVSVVQGYGVVGAPAWPGLMDAANPVDVAVAWDGLVAPNGGDTGGAAGNVPLFEVLDPALRQGMPAVVPRVPTMGHSSEYGLTPTPFLMPPDPEGHKAAYAAWRDAGVPVFELTIQGSSHYEWSLLPSFPTTSWCPDAASGQCRGGWGQPMAEHYTLAWLDRWLKRSVEPGFRDADARLLDDTGPQGRAKMSVYYRSARAFTDRRGRVQVCEDIRAGC